MAKAFGAEDARDPKVEILAVIEPLLVLIYEDDGAITARKKVVLRGDEKLSDSEKEIGRLRKGNL
jgi:hypothetical protein